MDCIKDYTRRSRLGGNFEILLILDIFHPSSRENSDVLGTTLPVSIDRFVWVEVDPVVLLAAIPQLLNRQSEPSVVQFRGLEKGHGGIWAQVTVLFDVVCDAVGVLADSLHTDRHVEAIGVVDLVARDAVSAWICEVTGNEIENASSSFGNGLEQHDLVILPPIWQYINPVDEIRRVPRRSFSILGVDIVSPGKYIQSMLKQLFTDEGWDQGDTFSFIFYNVTLKVPIGKYPAGTKFTSALVDFEESYIGLWTNETIPEGKVVAPGECLQSFEAARYPLRFRAIEAESALPVVNPTKLTTVLVDA